MVHLTVTPMISIRPNRLSLTQLVRRVNLGDFFEKSAINQNIEAVSPAVQPAVSVEKKKLEKKFHEFKISENSQRNLRDKISYLFQFAKSRRIKTYSGKVLPNFKICFLTLTLPSEQIHTTADIY